MIHLPILSVSSAPPTVILANGEFPVPGTIAYHILEASLKDPKRQFYCCDGAYNRLNQLSLGELPNMVIGDLDSLTEEEFPELKGRLCRIEEQETNDLTKTVRYALDANQSSIPLCLLAIGGLRDDHMLGNISLLARFVLEGAAYIVAPTACGCFYAVRDALTIPLRRGQQVSIFNFGGQPLTSEGLKWELNGQTLPELWMGTLNQATGDSLSIYGKAPFVLYLANECKLF